VTGERTVVEAVQADLTTLDLTAIVNAANSALRGGSGVCGAIFRAAGWDEMQAACDEIGGCPTGEAVVTPGFGLRATWVIHTVGPVWHGGRQGEPELLRSCYRRSLEVAGEIGAVSIGFPAVSTGIYGYPADAAADVAVETVTAYRGPVSRILLVAFDHADVERYQRLLARPRR
jgi:O-acetyl-ADP-ribose deacetylase (regulator of RNase III)